MNTRPLSLLLLPILLCGGAVASDLLADDLEAERTSIVAAFQRGELDLPAVMRALQEVDAKRALLIAGLAEEDAAPIVAQLRKALDQCSDAFTKLADEDLANLVGAMMSSSACKAAAFEQAGLAVPGKRVVKVSKDEYDRLVNGDAR